MTSSYKVQENGIVRDMTSEEKAEVDARNTAWENDKPNRQLANIRELRNRPSHPQNHQDCLGQHRLLEFS